MDKDTSETNSLRECLGRNPVTNIMRRSRSEVESIVRGQIKEVVPFLNQEINPRQKFNLDTTKIAYHPERVDAYLRGEKIAPIAIDMALTQKCSYACTFCFAGLQQNRESPISWEIYEGFLDDCVEVGHKPGNGVKAISLVSDGESTENPLYSKFIHGGRERGIEMASGTNGLKIKPEEIPQLVKDLTYIRFNFNAGEPQAYSEIMGTDVGNFFKVADNIKRFVKLKKETGSPITIGLQQVLLPEYADQVIPLALLGREFGVDYTVIKHCSDDERGSLGVDYRWYRSELATDLLRTAEGLSTNDYSVQVKWSKMRTGRDRVYSKCFGTPFLLQLSGTGLVAPCGSFFNQKYKRFHIGHIEEERFKDILVSERYWEVMSHLRSDKFDPRHQCATLCLQDKINEVLFDLIDNGKKLPDTSGKPVPIHVNFI